MGRCGEEGLDGFFGVMSGSQDSIGASLEGEARDSEGCGRGGVGVDLPASEPRLGRQKLAIPLYMYPDASSRQPGSTGRPGV